MSDVTPLTTNLPRNKSADALGTNTAVDATSPGGSIPGEICKLSKDGFIGYRGDVAHSLSNDYYSDDDDSVEIDGGDGNPRKYSGDGINVIRAQKDGSFDLCGSMYKRRGGLGRNAENKWIMRCFTLYGPILCYHEEAKIEQVADPSNPRARLNLLKTETIAEMHSKHKPGLPTEHLLTVNIYSNLGKRKWEMCCTSKEQQIVWYNAINAYDGKAIYSGGGGTGANRSPSYDNDDMDPNVLLSPTEARENLTLSVPDIGSSDRTEFRPRLTSSSGLSIQDIELVAKAAARAAVSMSQESFSKQRHNDEISRSHVILFIVVMNAASYWIRHGSEQSYKITLFFLNAYVLYVSLQKMSDSTKTTLKGPKARAARAKKHIPPSMTSTTSSSSPHKPKRKGTSKLLPMGSTIPKNTMQPHSYSNSDSSLFNLRIGPNYKKNKQKAPSGPALYELHSMDFVYADTALKRTSDKFVIPSIPGVTDTSTGHSHIPPVLIINTWLPGEEPSLFSKTTDGESYSIPMMFVMTKDTFQQLKDIENASPAVKLWSEWCLKAETDAEFRGRFKCMGMIEDIETTGVPKFIQGYNGKPALVTKSGCFKRYDNYVEFTINVGMWAFPARKGLHTLAPKFPDFIVNIGFTIEGRSDEELPGMFPLAFCLV
eukprot:CCRYP_005452-RB/>CCRYP_005452-RB protein AED:0.07 eAED:0.07 QI:257/1/1/1/1/1/4/322/654